MKTVLRIILLCILLAMLTLSACAEADGTLTLPGNLTEIGEEAFTGLEAAQTVIVPPTVTKIGARAVSGSGAVSACSSLMLTGSDTSGSGSSGVFGSSAGAGSGRTGEYSRRALMSSAL